jgi:hypothetical protein
MMMIIIIIINYCYYYYYFNNTNNNNNYNNNNTASLYTLRLFTAVPVSNTFAKSVEIRSFGLLLFFSRTFVKQLAEGTQT